jgi:hypothetical protein
MPDALQTRETTENMKKPKFLLSLALMTGPIAAHASTVVAEWDNGVWGETANNLVHWAQTFEPTQSGILDTVTIYGHGGTAPDIIPIPTEVTFTIYDLFAPSTLSPLGSDTVDTTSLTELAAPISASFNSANILLEGGHKYAFGISYPTDHNELLFMQVSDGGYPGGSLSRIDGDSLSEDNLGFSLRFRITADPSSNNTVPDSSATAVLMAASSAGVMLLRTFGPGFSRRFV